MSKLTRANIAYDLNVSPHTTEVIYDIDSKIKFIFSSEFYKNKFIKECGEHREKISESLSKRFGFIIENNILADIKLYASIEKRGFLIIHNGEAIECLDSIILDGKTLIMRN